MNSVYQHVLVLCRCMCLLMVAYPMVLFAQIHSSDDKPVNQFTDSAFNDATSASRFLTQATFGPSMTQINAVTGTSASTWVLNEFNKPMSLNLPQVRALQALMEDAELSEFNSSTTSTSFWTNAITAHDQLRQRIAFALSEILVVSNAGGDLLGDIPEAVGNHQDILVTHAFGNYRELLEAITYSPGMGFYLTYMGNKKADPITGRKPDENYARELLQLFTIGLIQLNKDGSAVLDSDGLPIEIYDNDDITGLAKVFTGLNLNAATGTEPDEEPLAFTIPMLINEQDHSLAEKSFLGFTIPANIPAATSISLALDHIMEHPNVGPFIGKQLIQRLVTSNPKPAYIERVATAFDTGLYQLPNGQMVGDGRLGNLKATVAAILFDDEARNASAINDNDFGKVREPILIFTHWARAFEAMEITPEVTWALWDTSHSDALSQHPYRPKSVFNFFRPGYVPPGSSSGAAGLTVPEMQIISATSIPGYLNFMQQFIGGYKYEDDFFELEELFFEEGVDLDADAYFDGFIPNYETELSLASQPEQLVDRLNLLLASGQLSPATKTSIINLLNAIPMNNTGAYLFGAEERVKMAILMIMSSPDYLVQR